MTSNTPTPAPTGADRILVRSPAAAETLSISERTLWTLTAEGELPCVRIGKAVRYRPEALKEWAEAREKGGADR
jgi:excisionase family DNA binding protein